MIVEITPPEPIFGGRSSESIVYKPVFLRGANRRKAFHRSIRLAVYTNDHSEMLDMLEVEVDSDGKIKLASLEVCEAGEGENQDVGSAS